MMSIVNGIFKGVWGGFSSLNYMLRSGQPTNVVSALLIYFVIILGVFGVIGFLFGGSSYKCVEWRDDGLVSFYDSTTKTTRVRQERTCMVKVHKEFTGSVEVR
jgi:hypothetical protein